MSARQDEARKEVKVKKAALPNDGESNRRADERLDLTSDRFDAELALKVDQQLITLPSPNAPIFDNLAKYESRTWHSKDRTHEKPTETIELAQRLTAIREQQRSTVEMIDSTQQRKKEQRFERLERRNVCNWMQTVSGPLSLLTALLHKNVRVMVRRRRIVSTAGESPFALIRGRLLLFDKHMNLVLNGAREHVSTRTTDRPASRERVLGHVFLRGDQIVYVSGSNAVGSSETSAASIQVDNKRPTTSSSCA